MQQGQPSPLERHPRIAIALLMLVIALITLFALEFGFRVTRDWARGSPWIARAENIDDADLGWALNPDKQRVTKKNACGETVERGTPAGRYLNKFSAAENALPVLFIGDSFTQGTEVSSAAIYYEVFEKSGAGRYAVSAAGVGGFSTAQEYKLLDKVFATVRPRIIFWQMTSNDIGENVYVGTDISTVQKQRLYYDVERDSFSLRNPATWLLEHSELAKYTYGELLKVERSHPFGMQRAVAWMTASAQPVSAAEVERRGEAVAKRLIGRAIREHPGTRFIGFSADTPRDAQYQRLFEEQGGLYVAGLTAKMRQASSKPLDCLPVDGHWNTEGNRVAGELLLQYVVQNPAALQSRASTP